MTADEIMRLLSAWLEMALPRAGTTSTPWALWPECYSSTKSFGGS